VAITTTNATPNAAGVPGSHPYSSHDDDIVIITKPTSPTVDRVLTAAGYRVATTTAHHTIYSLGPDPRHHLSPPEEVSELPAERAGRAGRAALTVAEAAHLLGISTSHAYHLVQTGSVPAVRLGRRVLIPRHVLDDLLR